MKSHLIALIGLFAIGASYAVPKGLPQSEKQRLIVTTDLGGTDPDDTQSMIHLLVCSNMMDIEGLISSQVWMDDPDKTGKIKAVVEQFGEVLPRLRKHAGGYPDLDYLRSITLRGQEKSNMSGVGEGKDSPGSELIIAAVDNPKEVEAFVSKIRIYDILGQDDAGAWIAKNFPDIVYIRNTQIYGWGPSDEWTKNNIQNCLPLGKHYPDRVWATEGDSPSFFYVYANGLNVPEHIDYGGWGGRFSLTKTSGIRGMDFIVRNGKDETQYDPYYMHPSAPEGIQAINRWRQHIWNDFAARMAWTTTDDYEAVNHHPVAVIQRDRSLRCIYRTARPGEELRFDASKSHDPDGDRLGYRWSVYKEPSSYKNTVPLSGDTTARCQLTIPDDAAGKTIHLILEVTDDGTPSLTAYQRVVIEVE